MIEICLVVCWMQMPALPVVRDRDWVRVPLDAFVLRERESNGKSAAKEEELAVVVRSTTRILLGRDADAAEIQAIVSSRDGRAFEKAVDRWIESPEFRARFAPMAKELRKDDPASPRRVAEQAMRMFLGRLDDEHRAALDWLAREIVSPTVVNCCELDKIPRDWDVGHLARVIAIIATFRSR